MKEFEDLIAKHGLSSLLTHIHALVIIAKKDGTLEWWNHAFEVFKPALPADTKLQDLFENREDFAAKTILKKQERWMTGLFLDPIEKPLLCDCTLLPLADEHVLFVAEHMHSDPFTLEKLQRLSKQVDEFKNETDQAKKIANRKQIEVDAVLVQSKEIAHIDQLTHLPNRQLIVRELQSEVLRAGRYKTPFTISMLDVDHFKRINDANGHLAGDETLKRVGQVLRDHIRHPDQAGRYGGEEFLVLLPNSDTRAASEQAARLCALIRDMSIQFGESVLKVTVSIGIAEFRHETDTWDSLLNRADTAMYEAKSSGRDRWTIASS